MSYDNTVGSRSSKNEELAYIAGFLDGDGSLMLQVKKRSDSKRGVRFMATICLYQDSRHEAPLLWMRTRLKCGYVSRRNDGMTELRINGFSQVRGTLEVLLPHLHFKKKQAKLLLVIQKENYRSGQRKTKEDLCKILGLTP
jgi:hypothetical protein